MCSKFKIRAKIHKILLNITIFCSEFKITNNLPTVTKFLLKITNNLLENINFLLKLANFCWVRHWSSLKRMYLPVWGRHYSCFHIYLSKKRDKIRKFFLGDKFRNEFHLFFIISDFKSRVNFKKSSKNRMRSSCYVANLHLKLSINTKMSLSRCYYFVVIKLLTLPLHFLIHSNVDLQRQHRLRRTHSNSKT